MVVINLNKVLKTDFYIKNIFAVNIVPKLRVLNKISRQLNGYIYVIEGEMEFHYDNKKIRIYPGCLIYLPCGSKHIYRAISEKIRYIRLDFDMYTATEHKKIVFSTCPNLISNKTDYKIIEIFTELAMLFSKVDPLAKFKANALVFELFYTIETTGRNQKALYGPNSIVAQCIDYIKMHYSEDISIDYLCKINSISHTHLRRIFKSATGYTVTDYINKCRIDNSLPLLKKTDMNIINVAYSVGYNSQNYYSRVFKSFVGKSPIEYRKACIEQKTEAIPNIKK